MSFLSSLPYLRSDPKPKAASYRSSPSNEHFTNVPYADSSLRHHHSNKQKDCRSRHDKSSRVLVPKAHKSPGRYLVIPLFFPHMQRLPFEACARICWGQLRSASRQIQSFNANYGLTTFVEYLSSYCRYMLHIVRVPQWNISFLVARQRLCNTLLDPINSGYPDSPLGKTILQTAVSEIPPSQQITTLTLQRSTALLIIKFKD